VSVTKRLADRHEEDIHEWLGGRKTRASGSQWADQADGRHNHLNDNFAFAWDCKCAMPGTKSISITRDMLEKLEHQVQAERPMLPIRFYADERGGVEYDYIAVRADDLREMLEALNEK
jgi:hypothetical protein